MKQKKDRMNNAGGEKIASRMKAQVKKESDYQMGLKPAYTLNAYKGKM